jgi:hypothetical protein
MAIYLSPPYLFTGSSDGTIKKWPVTLAPYNGTDSALGNPGSSPGSTQTPSKNSSLSSAISFLILAFTAYFLSYV